MLSNASPKESRKSAQWSSVVGVGRGDGVGEGLGELEPEPVPEWSPLGAWLGSGVGTVTGACPTDSIVVVARSVQTTGFGLPVAAVALSARSAVAAAAS